MAPQTPPSSNLVSCDFRTQIIDNCEFILTKDDIITVVTSKDPSEKFYKSYAIKVNESSREATLVSDPCETAQQAIESLHKKSCEAIHNYITLNGFANPQDVKTTFDAIAEFDDDDGAASVVSGHSESSTAAFSEWGHQSNDDRPYKSTLQRGHDNVIPCGIPAGFRSVVHPCATGSKGWKKCCPAREDHDDDDNDERMTLRLMREALGEADLSDFENLSPPQAARRSTTADHQQPAGIHVTNHHHNQQEQHQQASSSSPSLAFRGGGAPPPTPGWTGPPAPPPSMQGMPPHMLPLHTGNQNHQHNHNHNRHGLQPRGSLQPQLLAQTQPQPPLYFDWQRHHHPHHQGGCFSTGVPPTLACIPPAFAPGLASGNINVRNTHDLAKPNLYVGITRPVTTAATIPATVCTTGIVTPTATPSSSGESVTSTESSINGNSANKPTNSTNSKRLAFAALAKTSGPTIPIKTKSPINKNNVPSTSIRQHPRPLSMPAVAAAANTPPPSPRLYAVRLMIHWLRHGQHRIVTCVFGRLCDLLMAAMADVQGNPGAYPYHRPTGIPPPPPPPVYSSAFKNGYAGVIGNNRAGERQAGPSTGAPTPGTGMTGPAPPPAVVPTIHGTLRAIVLRGIVRGEAIDMRSSGDDLSRLYASLGPDEVPAFEVLVDEVLMSSPDEASDADDGDDEEDGYGARYRDVAAGV